MREFRWGGNRIVPFILAGRDLGLASLCDGAEEVEGSVGDDIRDPAGRDYAGDVHFEWHLWFTKRSGVIDGGSMGKSRAQSDVICQFLSGGSIAHVFVIYLEVFEILEHLEYLEW